MIPPRATFPEGFLFGAATAAYQIEGSRFGGAGPSHWDTFAATPGNVVRAEDGGLACDHYHRWPEDLDLIAAAGFDAYRFSTSWARVMPDGVTVNPEGLDFYDRLVDGMVARGLQPFLTLYHWDLPAALSDLGGWRNRDTAFRFADFAETVARRIGDRVASVATINEPWCVAWLSHFHGAHAPGLRDIRAAARAMHHILLAHGAAMESLRGLGQPNLGIVLNFDHATPASDAPADLAAAAVQDAIFNRWFIEGLTKGTYPAEALAGLGPHMPTDWQADMGLISGKLDWLGVNYYTRHIHAAAPGTPWPATREVPGPLEKTQMGWEIYPEGLQRFLTRLARDHVGDLPIYVTENGMAHADVVGVDDSLRESFIAQHFRAAQQAMAAGCNLQGFFYWSLLDNYEWAEGYEKRFGLVHVDFDSLARTPKASYHALKRALARN
ncbi:beta-glucosidase [Gemmobacter fulvus]|uniref:Beta-glucosidase n=1 Tax=Gemmobacter fulvus TaxID=2840474 RepID=A0A975S1T6_9RHOB|nr:GH1 family beta-glucosidase [Gemmobacter fulvus]MBT9245263.1 beta-glucosidase [Gemmobacter fulvus]MDQ1848133.1 GH1 family beta-glucosidase [Gemmobacter fulvus]QWK90410.1 beta-glucosidase [Gemmobacter fulvus]